MTKNRDISSWILAYHALISDLEKTTMNFLNPLVLDISLRSYLNLGKTKINMKYKREPMFLKDTIIHIKIE